MLVDFLFELRRHKLHVSTHEWMTLMEAMALGLPVVASNYSGNLDFMDTRNSVLIPTRVIETDDKWFRPVDITSTQPFHRERTTAVSEIGLTQPVRSNHEGHLPGTIRVERRARLSGDRPSHTSRGRRSANSVDGYWPLSMSSTDSTSESTESSMINLLIVTASVCPGRSIRALN